MIKKQDLPEGFTFVEAELGDGDLLVAGCHRQGVERDSGILITENPNGKRPCGEDYPEIEGEVSTCISKIGMVIYFKTAEDVDALILNLTGLRERMVEGGYHHQAWHALHGSAKGKEEE